MDNPQLVDYIRSQMAAGHAEVTIRDHLIKHGWPAEKVAAAFAYCNRSHVASVSSKKHRGSSAEPRSTVARPRRGGRGSIRRNGVKLRIVAATLAVLIGTGAATLLLNHHKTEQKPLVVREPTLQQKQTLDVLTLGGAVGQYVATNDKTLPSSVSAAPDGSNSVVLCGAVCNPSSWQVSSLSAYKPTGIKMVAYSPGLDVPDVSTLLLVSGARCSPDRTELSTKDVKSLSMAILYASQDGATFKDHCVVL